MTTVLVNKFDGGHAEDVRTSASDQSEQSLNFDIFKEPHRLNPYPDTATETITAGSEISDIILAKIGGTTYIVGAGYKGTAGSVELTFYTKSSITGNFSANASATGNTYVKGTLINYKDEAYAVDDNGAGQYRLIKCTGGAVSTIGSITATTGQPVTTFVHPEDNILYVIIGNNISKYDGSSFTGDNTSILPTNWQAQSATNYGGYLAIVIQPLYGKKRPVCVLWGRDTTLNTLQTTIDLGEGYCPIVENIDNALISIISSYVGASPSGETFTTINNIKVKIYQGGTAETVKEVQVPDTLASSVFTYKAKKGSRVYFGTSNSNALWVFGKNKKGNWTISQSAFMVNGGAQGTGNTFYGVSIIGDYFWTALSNNGTFKLQRTTTTYTSTSTYKTTINPNMPSGDTYKDKTLVAVQIAVTGAATGTTGLKYSVDGSTMTSIISQSNSIGEQVYDATMQNDGSALLSGRELQFQIETTGGAKPKEIRYKYNTTITNL